MGPTLSTQQVARIVFVLALALIALDALGLASGPALGGRARHLGAPAVFVIAALVLAAQSKMMAAGAPLAFGFVVIFIADHFIRLLIGNATRLPFSFVLLGIFEGLETFGLIGLFLGPAIMSVLFVVWREGAARVLVDPMTHGWASSAMRYWPVSVQNQPPSISPASQKNGPAAGRGQDVG